MPRKTILAMCLAALAVTAGGAKNAPVKFRELGGAARGGGCGRRVGDGGRGEGGGCWGVCRFVMEGAVSVWPPAD